MRFHPSLVLAAMLTVLSVPANSDEDLSVEAYLGSTVFEACGLDKLEPEELARLSLYLAPPDLQSFEIDAALAFLAKEGWQLITLYAGVKVDPERSFSDIRHLAFTRDGQFILEKGFAGDPTLPAGHYLGKVGAFSVTVLDVYGRELRLDIEEE